MFENKKRVTKDTLEEHACHSGTECLNDGDCENCERRFSEPVNNQSKIQTIEKIQGL